MLVDLDKKGFNANARKTEEHFIVSDKVKNIEVEQELLQHDLEETIAKMQRTINNLRYKNEQLQHSKTYRAGKLVVAPIRRVYNHRYVGFPLRLAHGMVRPESKPVIAGGNAVYADISVRPHTAKFNIDNSKIHDQKKVKIAAIMDEFTYSSFAPECTIVQLTPEKWFDEIEQASPDMMFIESAWRGVDDKWKFLLNKDRRIITELILHCRNKNIPVVFWNKEDPAHTAEFLPLASMCDFVFTSDIRSIEVYRDVLGHSCVYLLPFAAQPKINNPVEEYKREDKVSFAGSYYSKYEHRCDNFMNLVGGIEKAKDLVIYDRNFDRNLGPAYSFPEEMQKYVKGSLPYSEIAKAYKGYNYAINMNTVQTSPTMFARRVFELVASNTVVISNFSLGVKKIFGDLVITTNDGKYAAKKIKEISEDRDYLDAFKLTGLRSVLQHHTYAHRLDYLCEKVFSNYKGSNKQTELLVVSCVKDNKQAKDVLANFERQDYPAKKLLLVTEGKNINVRATAGVTIAPRGAVAKGKMSLHTKKSKYISFMHPEDYYGKHYLTDLALAFTYTDASAVGKNKTEYTKDVSIEYRASCLHKDIVQDKTVAIFLKAGLSNEVIESDTLSIDRFNYLKNYKKTGKKSKQKTLELIDGEVTLDNAGEDFTSLYREAEDIAKDLRRAKAISILKRLRVRKTIQPIKMEYKK